jgi:hypothetical protein
MRSTGRILSNSRLRAHFARYDMTTLILAVALYLGRGTPSHATVDAIASTDATPLEVALLVVYGARESSWQVNAVGDGGKSCGTWQQACSRVRGLSERDRARLWIWDLRHSSLAAVDSSPARASRRLAIARAALAGATAGR